VGTHNWQICLQCSGWFYPGEDPHPHAVVGLVYLQGEAVGDDGLDQQRVRLVTDFEDVLLIDQAVPSERGLQHTSPLPSLPAQTQGRKQDSPALFVHLLGPSGTVRVTMLLCPSLGTRRRRRGEGEQPHTPVGGSLIRGAGREAGIASFVF
jgi:hypothetical protein